MSTWDEIRTAYHVARMGTVSGAAEALGVHHATVIRHIDALEARLGVKLFQRHARGYTSTEAGQDLLQVAQATDDQFTQLVGRIRGRGDGVSGELVVTSLSSASPRLTGTLARFQAQYPGLIVRYLTGDEVLRLEYGEAHVAVRAGRAPDNPDNVVQPFVPQRVSLFASESYIAEHGRPETTEDLTGHSFVSLDNFGSRAPFVRWLMERVTPEQIIFRGTDNRVLRDAIIEGVGIGFISDWEAEKFPTLVRLFDSREEWSAPLWLVTHVDLHRTTKVQAFLKFLKEDVKNW
ncbi:LysR family transcriptional regulator [Alphaproteobacteria bacterium GH1-50]|uniref:LysR family transcriptional regulator n=1 Tax=Kangsaoukella pontilimi TaxID=2691042 RepID=A0A7C9II55_9RHOB|nr:LysR family transcriptional regulator [Kangsaoukella pontilimi]MXQ09464.1 LysR family transcriptional regulator [Kangsaoukella pontilimi]